MIVQVDEVIAVSRDTNEKAAVFLGIFLGFAQRFRVDYVELDMMSSEIEIGSYESRHFFQSSLSVQNRGKEPLVQKSPSGFDLVHLAEGFHHCRGAPAVGAVGGRRSVRFRNMGEASVRCRSEFFSEINVACG